MTETELKNRCEALAPFGDSAAAATLELIWEVEKLRMANVRLATAARGVPGLEDEKLVSDAKYVLKNIAGMMRLAIHLKLIDPVEVAQLVPLEDLKIPWGPGVHFPTGTLKNSPLDSPEDLAAAATRKANGLPEETDPAALAANPSAPAGHYDKTDKMGNPVGKDDAGPV